MHNIEIWIVMNSDTEYATGVDRDHAIERFEEEIGSAAGCRVARLKVKMEPPTVAEVEVEVPDDAGETVEAEAA